MFVIAALNDTISVHPSFFDVPIEKVVGVEIEAKYANKVIPDTGLCVCLYDITSIGTTHVYAGDGSAHAEVAFKLVVFRPFEGEILEGLVKSSTPDGIVVTLGFFEDVSIPHSMMRSGSFFDAKEKVWVLKFPVDDNDDDSGSAEEEEEDGSRLQLDVDELVRFRVATVRYRETGAAAALSRRGAEALAAGERLSRPAADGSLAGGVKREAAMTIVGSITEYGLGLTSWWDYDDEEGGEDETAA